MISFFNINIITGLMFTRKKICFFFGIKRINFVKLKKVTYPYVYVDELSGVNFLYKLLCNLIKGFREKKLFDKIIESREGEREREREREKEREKMKEFKRFIIVDDHRMVGNIANFLHF